MQDTWRWQATRPEHHIFIEGTMKHALRWWRRAGAWSWPLSLHVSAVKSNEGSLLPRLLYSFLSRCLVQEYSETRYIYIYIYMVHFTPQPLYSRGKSPHFPLDRRLGRQKWKMLLLPGHKLRSFCRPTRAQSVYRLRYGGCTVIHIHIGL
jgi:hypothetical protein